LSAKFDNTRLAALHDVNPHAVLKSQFTNALDLLGTTYDIDHLGGRAGMKQLEGKNIGHEDQSYVYY